MLVTAIERSAEVLTAEIHGKYVPEARNFEDYLTSAIFGHLRYIKPGPFWDVLLSMAKSQPGNTDVVTATERTLCELGCSPGAFAALDIAFWPEHKEGIPDLVLHFSGGQPRSVVVLIEAKLTSMKSGTGEYDQLVRYLRILDSLGDLRPAMPSGALGLAVYLTATDSRVEVLESLQQCNHPEQDRIRLFHLQWQDLIRAIDLTSPASEMEALILNDVRTFLRKRGLEYFSGMEDETTIPLILREGGEFLKNEPLFEMESIPTHLEIIEETWIHAN